MSKVEPGASLVAQSGAPLVVQPSSNEEAEKKRGGWGGQAEFLLTCIGYAVGLGNVWRFPYLCFRNGGGAFIIPYAIALLTLGLPIFFFELSIGQFASRGQIKVWKANPMFKGVGFAMLTSQWIVSLYYNVIIAWCLFYLFASMGSPVPWADCTNEWNTMSCIVMTELKQIRDNCTGEGLVDSNCTLLHDELTRRGLSAVEELKSPSDEFFFLQVIKRSSGIDESGGIVWQLALCLLLSYIIIFLVLINGVQSLGKAMYFFTVFPYVMMIIFVIRGATLPGAREGMKFYMEPDVERLKDGNVWADAATQIFYSLSTCSGGLISMASYNKFKNNALRDSIMVPLINCGTSIFCGCAIFTMLGFMAGQKGVEVPDVVDEGPGLVFVVYPEGITQMPGPTVWAVLFFLMMVTLGFSSMFSMTESVFVAIMDQFPDVFHGKRRNAILLRLVALIFYFLVSLPMVTRGGYYLFDLVDGATSGFPLLFIGFFELIAINWIYGWRRFIEDILMMLGHKKFWDFGFYIVCWVVVSPVLLLVLIVVKGIQTGPFTVEGMVLPPFAQALGWMIVAFILVWIPLWMIVRSGKDKSCKVASTPDPDWGPALDENKTGRYAPQGIGVLPAGTDVAILSNKELEATTYTNEAYEGKES